MIMMIMMMMILMKLQQPLSLITMIILYQKVVELSLPHSQTTYLTPILGSSLRLPHPLDVLVSLGGFEDLIR